MNQKNAKTTEKMLALEQSIYGVLILLRHIRRDQPVARRHINPVIVPGDTVIQAMTAIQRIRFTVVCIEQQKRL